jgi:SagB-type dehydrogenase family enzyme
MDYPQNLKDLSKCYPAAMIYHENSTLNPARERMFRERILAFGQVEYGRSEKTYPLHPNIYLPTRPLLRKSVERVIEKRRTRRTFTKKGVPAAKLARILKCAYGVTHSASEETGNVMFRACPSAGALYPLEIYPVVLRSIDLATGVYHYNVKDHILEYLKKGDFQEQLDNNLLGTELMPGADIALLITSDLELTMAKYGERGYRFILIEVGHLAQNISLVCEAMRLNSVCLGGFYEDGLAGLLSTDVRREPVQYVVLLGTR